jgi:ketosteroid isomerase-like protein
MSDPQATVAAGYDALNAAGAAGILPLLADDAVCVSIDPRLRLRREYGAPAVAGYLDEVIKPLAEYSILPLAWESREDQVFAWVSHRGRAVAGAPEASWEAGHLWTVRDGRLSRFRLYLRREKGLRALSAGSGSAAAGRRPRGPRTA